MPIIKTFVSHHGGDFASRVAPILRQVAPLGVRGWIDKEDLVAAAGLRLDQALQEAIFSGACHSLSLFLSKASATRKWIEQEVQYALERAPQGFRILPILLDPLGEIDLPPGFREFLEHRQVIWLDPAAPGFLRQYAASALAAGGATGETRAITLCLGHRSPHWGALLPEEFPEGTAVDLRLDLKGREDLSPSEAEWREIEEGLVHLRGFLGGLEEVRVCGQAPLGVGTLIGKVWDRGAGRRGPIRISAHNFRTRQVWSTDAQDDARTTGWTPDRAAQVKMERPAPLRHETLLVAFVREDRAQDYLRKVRAWSDGRGVELIHATVPVNIRDAEEARQVACECVGVLRYLRQVAPRVKALEIVPTYPLALAPLVAHHLRNVGGEIRVYDEVKGADEYRLVTTLR